eukprot:450755-Pelagomonas_calceolata.AAC.11
MDGTSSSTLSSTFQLAPLAHVGANHPCVVFSLLGRQDECIPLRSQGKASLPKRAVAKGGHDDGWESSA